MTSRARRSISLLLLSLVVAVPAHAKEKKKKVKWKQVVELQKEPTTCEFLENVAGDGKGPFTFTNNQAKNKLRERAKKATASASGNAFWMEKIVHEPHNYRFEAKTYWCDEMPPTVDEAK